jgi:hypothetical protein
MTRDDLFNVRSCFLRIRYFLTGTLADKRFYRS